MKHLFDQIKVLHDQELYSNVVRLGSLAATICDQKQDAISPLVKFNFYIQYGNALFCRQQYAQAERIFTQALLQKKSLMKVKVHQKISLVDKDVLPDTEIKYKIHQCFIKMNKLQKAAEVLQHIPPRSRTTKINMALGDLYKDMGMERSAISSYKEVLRECPMALEAAEALLSLGVTGVEINSLMLSGMCDVSISSLITPWLRGQAQMQSREYSNAVATFKSLDKPGLLKNNVTLLTTIGQCHFYNGANSVALTTLRRVFSLDPNIHFGLDMLAVLLSKESPKDLEKLVPPDLDLAHYSAEHYVAVAYYMYVNKKYVRATYLAQKACRLSPRNVEALLLKSCILYDIKKYQDSISHLRVALQISPFRFEAHKGLVDCYVAMNRIREALTMANNSYKKLGQNPRALSLYASVLMKDPLTISQAETLLERALILDVNHLPAVYMLSEIYEKEMRLDAAAQLLLKHSNFRSSSRLHQMLGDIYCRMNNDEKAYQHYTMSLNLNPNNTRAQEGMNVIGRSKLYDSSSYYLTTGSDQSTAVQNSGFSDQEPDLEMDLDSWPYMDWNNYSSFWQS